MSTDTPPSPRSSSPTDESITADESFMIRLKDIKTIAQLYKRGVLKAVAPENRRWDPEPNFLERVSLYQGDITTLEVDSIVNAANRSLLGGGGVDGAIHGAAGPKLLEECRGLNGCLTGQSKITRGYDLPARHVIHTVGPIYNSEEKVERAQQLASAYRTSLAVAVENSIRHVAFPSISTGIYSYPVPDATRIALNEVRTFLESEHGDELERVIFVVWSSQDKSVYESLIPEFFPPGEKAKDPEPTAALSESDGSGTPAPI
ncbi:A1pp-domain-containing protein [Phlegmacium glaucopus]|nr:A1pp-domain-containing protein [Phlegmacium glaucopus]